MGNFLAVTWKFLVGALAASFILYFVHLHIVDNLEDEMEQAVEDQAATDVKLCEESKQPTDEANNVSETNNAALLADCTAKLREPKKCIPVYVSRPAGCSQNSSEQPTGGITSSEVEAARIECQKDRNDLNAAKVWGQGYDRVKNAKF